MDPAAGDVLDRPPRRPGEPMLRLREWGFIVTMALLDAAVVLGVYVSTLHTHGLDAARNLTFSTLVFVELFRSFAARHPERIFWEVGAWTNLRLVAVVALTGAMQVALHYVPVMQQLFHVAPLSVADLALAVGLGLVPVTILEVAKLLRRALRRSG
jgi:Ca2+-transporting ATPase